MRVRHARPVDPSPSTPPPPASRAALEAILARLSPDQRAAATAPPGPILCVAPAGAGKTTTLVARVAVRVADGTPPDRIRAVTFNRRAAAELRERLDAALVPLGVTPGTVAVSTFHALGLEILRDGRRGPAAIVDRAEVLRGLWPDAPRAARAALDDAISRAKLDPGAGAMPEWLQPPADAYAGHLHRTGAIDLDDLVAGALALLRSDPALLARWRDRCAELLVDEVQDVDATQLELALTLARPAARILLVGDDDQSIYGWRLADVRRILTLDERLPGLRRFDLVTNRRCPAPVVARAVRLIEHNEERFAKAVRARDGATGRIVLVPEGGDEIETLLGVARRWSESGTQAVLARTNRELLAGLAVALELEIPFRAERLPELATDARIDAILEAAGGADTELPDVVRVFRGATELLAAHGADVDAARGAEGSPEPPALAGKAGDAVPDPAAPYAALVAALVGWTIREGSLAAVTLAVARTRERLARLSRDDARLTLATAHGTKGLEFDDVTVLGMTAGRFPSARSVSDAADPRRALEEERRLAYVAWTRARRSLTLVYEAADPSPFLLEAFDPDELAGGSPRGAGPDGGPSAPGARTPAPTRRPP